MSTCALCGESPIVGETYHFVRYRLLSVKVKHRADPLDLPTDIVEPEMVCQDCANDRPKWKQVYAAYQCEARVYEAERDACDRQALESLFREWRRGAFEVGKEYVIRVEREEFPESVLRYYTQGIRFALLFREHDEADERKRFGRREPRAASDEARRLLLGGAMGEPE